MKRHSFATLLLAASIGCLAWSESMAGPLPRGFTALFNGTNLDGWWGADTEDPRKYEALSPAEFQKKHDASLENIRQHWTVQNGELVNEGSGFFSPQKNLR